MKASVWSRETYSDGISPGTEGMLRLEPKFPRTRGGVMFVHGAGSDATYCMDAYGSQGKLTDRIVGEGYSALSGDHAGPQTWGSPNAIGRMTSNLERLFGAGGITPNRYALVSGSMGGINSINFAAQAGIKPAAIISVIPVINVEDIRANNRAGCAPAIEAAYNGGYNESMLGQFHNPYTMRSMSKLMGIPTLLFYGTLDTLCLPAYVEAYAAADPANRTLVAMPYGHEAAAYDAVNHDTVINFLNTHLG